MAASLRGRAHGHPAAKALWKQMKSATLRIGGVVDPSQLARGSPEANWDWKQMKSAMLSTGVVTDLSQLAEHSTGGGMVAIQASLPKLWSPDPMRVVPVAFMP